MTTNIGLLGAGRIGLTHARAISGIPTVRIAAVFDPIEAAAQVVMELTGARRAAVDEIMADVASRPGVEVVSARAQSYALTSSGERSFGAQIVGVQYEKEALWSSLTRMQLEGRYIERPGEAFIGSALARNLGISIGDEMVILGTAVEGGVDSIDLFVPPGTVHVNVHSQAWRLATSFSKTVKPETLASVEREATLGKRLLVELEVAESTRGGR